MFTTHTAIPTMTKNLPRSPQPSVSVTTLLIFAFIFLMPVAAGLLIHLVLPHFGLATKFGGTGHDGYLELARSLYNGQGYRFSADGPAVFHRPPLYPVLLAPLMGLSDTAIKISVVVINSLFLAMACLYTRRICALLFKQSAIGTIAMVLLVSNPWMLRLVSSPLSAVMQMALYSAMCFYFLRFCDQYRQFGQLPTAKLGKNFFQISLLATAMCFSHGTSIYVCAAIFVVTALTCIASREWKLLGFLLMTATLTLTALSPWALRNQETIGRVELSSSGAGFTYYLGNIYWGIDNGDYQSEQSTELNALRMGGVSPANDDMLSYWGVTDPVVDQQLRDAMVEHVKQHPSAIARKSLLNLSDIYFPITHTLFCQTGAYSVYCAESLSEYQIANRLTRTALMLLVVGLALAYLLSNRTQKPVLAWLALAGALLHTAPYLPIATYAHHGIYSLGAMPLLSALAAAMLYRLRVKRALNTRSENPTEIWYKASGKTQASPSPTPATGTKPALAGEQKGVKIDHIIG